MKQNLALSNSKQFALLKKHILLDKVSILTKNAETGMSCRIFKQPIKMSKNNL